MKQKKMISTVLVLCMVLSLFPTNLNTVWATEDTNISEMDALSALGIDTSTAPEGFDENDTSNPYGKDTVTINPISELYAVGLSENTSILDSHVTSNSTSSTITVDQFLKGTIYGHDDNTSKTTESIMNSKTNTTIASGTTTASGEYVNLTDGNSYLQTNNYLINSSLSGGTTGTFSMASSKVANGNFDGKQEGKSAQTVLVYTSKLSENGGLYMRVGDATSGEYGDAKELISTTKSIGNPSDLVADVKENFATDPYLMQNYLQVTTGDYDGDGTDEIAVFIPEYGKSRVEVYKLKTTTGQSDTAYRNASQWAIAWTYSLLETGYVSNMVSLVSGDFNEDGTTDLGATWGYYYGPNNNKGSKAVTMFGSKGKGNMLQASQQFDLTYGDSKIVRASFTFGDLTGSGSDVLILGGQSDSDIAAGNVNSRYVGIYSWNGTSFVANTSKNFDLFAKDKDGNYENVAMGQNHDKFYSSSLCPANLAVISQGLSESAYLYMDSLLLKYGDDGLEITAALDQAGANTGNTEYYVEYGVASGDLVGLGYDTAMTMQQTMSSVETVGHTDDTWHWYYKNWWNKFWNVKTWYTTSTSTSCSKFNPNNTYMIVMDVKNSYKTKTNVDSSTSICMQNTDDDTSYMRYTGTHYFTYSDPEVLAVLASPPYFSDLLNRDDLSGNYAESTTSYSSTKGSGGGDTFNTTIEVGAYVSVEQEFSVFGVVVASAEAEAAVTAGFTYETEKSCSLEQTISYSATAGEDMIAFYSIPLEIYEYSAYTSNGDGTYTEQKMTVNIPHTAAVQLLSLDSYENIAKDYDALPQISGTVLTHKLGDLSTYKSSSNGYLNAITYNGDWSKVGYSSAGGGSSISQEISMTNENSNSYSISGKIETKVGAGAGGVKVGVTFGAEIGGGFVTTSTSGNSFSGELQNMPIEAEDYNYSYYWKIFSYLYDDGRMSFPIVDYLVSDVVTPPSLPIDFKQNIEKTTDTEIAFNWTYDKQVAGFQIYRFYEFPDGSGSYDLSFIPMTKGTYNSTDKLYHFEYIDKELSPYTDYQYQIQTVRASVPNNSIPSEVVSARTKTDVGYPVFSIIGLDQDGYLRIYPDSTSSIIAKVENASIYNGKISYQWQKFIDGIWTDMGGKTSEKLTFASSGVSDETSYRCRANVIYYDSSRGDNYYISAYSNVFETKYSKRTPVIVDNSFIATTYNNDANGTGVNIGISLMSGNSSHYIAPTGNVTFTVTGTDYNVDHTVVLNTSSTANDDGKFTSLASLNIANLPNGVYEVSAYYSGNRVFQSLSTTENVTFLVGNSGYQLLLQNNTTPSVEYTYGDKITPTLKYLTNSAGQTSTSTISEDVTYEINDTPATLEAGRFRTPNVGNYAIKATLSGSGMVAERSFTVSQREIKIEAYQNGGSIGKGYVESKLPLLRITENEMAFEEVLSDLNLIIKATNSAGNSVTLDNSTEPGNYTIIAGTSSNTNAVKYNNYKATYIPSVYTIIGQTYFVDIKAEQYQNRDVGTITLSNSSNGLGAEFSAGTELLFYATPYAGYEVDSWSAIAKDTGATIILDSSQFKINKTQLSMTLNAEPIEVTVVFKKTKTTLTTAKEGDGTISCDSNLAFISGGYLNSGADITFTATPNSGYTFKEWIVESGVASPVNKTGTANADGSNTLVYTMGTSNTTLRAVFERDSYTIILPDKLEAVYYYEVDSLGTLAKKTVYSGAKIIGDTEVLVKVKAGYASDSVWKVNGTTVTPSTDGYTFNINEDTTILVDTNQLSYDITKVEENGTISTLINGNDATELISVAGGSNVVFTAHPEHGYAFDSYTVTGTNDFTQNGTELTIAELGSNITIKANFTKSTDYKVEVKYGTRANVAYILYDAFGNEVERNTVATGDYIDVVHGDDMTLVVTPNSGYMVDKWTIGGIADNTRSKIYTFEDISKDIDVLVDIISQTSYTVNYNVDGGNGSITSATTDGRNFASGDTDVGGNSTIAITSAPDANYMVDYWTINGAKVLNDDNTTSIGKTLNIDNLISQTTAVNIKVYFTQQVDHQILYDKTHVDINSECSPNDALTSGYVRDGAKAVFTIEPDTSYRIDSVVIQGGEYTIEKNEDSPIDDYGTWTATVNKANADLTVTAIAKKIHTITIDSTHGGTLSSATTTDFSTKAIEGETVQIYQSSNLDSTFETWNVSDDSDTSITVNGNANNGFSFDMPDSNVKVSATFKDISTIDINYDIYDTNGAEDGGYNGTLSATISRDGISGYPITIAESTTGGAISSINRGYTNNYVTWPISTVKFTANPVSGYKVLKWIVDGIEYNSSLNLPIPTISMNTLKLNVEQTTKNIDVLVQFEQIGDRITYDVDGENGSIISATNQLTTNEFISGNIISSPTTISLESKADKGYEVEAWLVDGSVVLTGSNNTYNYKADGENGAAITVKFARVPFTVTYGGQNGNVTSSQVENGKTVRGDTDVTFTAIANPGYAFNSYNVECSTNYTSNNNPLTIAITADTEVTANFVPAENCNIYYSVDGTNGNLKAVKNDSSFISGSKGAANDIITFTATPDPNYKVKAWNIDGTIYENDDTTFNLTVSKATHDVTVEFERSRYIVNFGILGGLNGTISAESNGSISTGNSLAKNSMINFNAVPVNGYQVKSWKINGVDVIDSKEKLSCKIDNLSQDTTVTVEFEVIPDYLITIKTSGTGEGTITAFVNDIETAITNGSLTVKNHDSVKLVATPMDEYNTAAWSVTNLTNYTINNINVLLNNVTDDVIATAAFKVAELITVKADAVKASQTDSNVNGTISAKAGYENDYKTINVITSTVNVTKGKTLKFTATPDNGYMIKAWLMNDKVVDELSNMLTVVPETNINVKVMFELIATYELPTNGANYTISNVIKAPDELQSPTYDDSIRQRGAITFKLTPQSGYYFKELTICGVDCFTKTSSNEGITENMVAAINNNDGSYTITVANITKEIEQTIFAVKPIVTISEATNGKITATYSYIDALQQPQTVTVSSGDSVPTNTELTVTATPESGYRFNDWNDFAYAKSGNPIKIVVPSSNIILSGTFTIKSSNGVGGGSYIPEPEPEPPIVENPPTKTYDDVTENDWYYKSVNYMVRKGLMKGVSDTEFLPNGNSSRSMLVTILFRLEGEPETNVNNFIDVDSDIWYANAASWALENDIISGIGDNKFAPDANVTREQIAVMLYRYAKYKNIDVTVNTGAPNFPDSDHISPWAMDAVKWAIQAKLITGRDDGNLDPTNNATRAEIATILQRFIESLDSPME